MRLIFLIEILTFFYYATFIKIISMYFNVNKIYIYINNLYKIFEYYYLQILELKIYTIKNILIIIFDNIFYNLSFIFFKKFILIIYNRLKFIYLNNTNN